MKTFYFYVFNGAECRFNNGSGNVPGVFLIIEAFHN